MITKARIQKWLDIHTMLWTMQNEHRHLLNDDEVPGSDDFDVSLCGIPNGIHLYVWSNEIYYKLVSILQVTVKFDPVMYDGEQVYASFMYNGIEVFTLLTKGEN